MLLWHGEGLLNCCEARHKKPPNFIFGSSLLCSGSTPGSWVALIFIWPFPYLENSCPGLSCMQSPLAQKEWADLNRLAGPQSQLRDKISVPKMHIRVHMVITPPRYLGSVASAGSCWQIRLLGSCKAEYNLITKCQTLFKTFRIFQWCKDWNFPELFVRFLLFQSCPIELNWRDSCYWKDIFLLLQIYAPHRKM